MSYNLIEDKEMPFKVEEEMGLVEFLRRLYRQQKLPKEFRILGFDKLLFEARDHVETARLIRNMLAEASDYLHSLYPETVIWIPVDAKLEENGHPRMYHRRVRKVIDLPNVFGDRLERKRRYWFEAGFNITRG